MGAGHLAAWPARAVWERLFNRSGTTFRKLPHEDTTTLTDARAIALMDAPPGLIRRPVLIPCDTLEIGFGPARHAATFGR